MCIDIINLSRSKVQYLQEIFGIMFE